MARDRSWPARLGAAEGSGPIELSLLPELQGERHRVDLVRMPPSSFVALSVELAMVDTTERNRELIADLAAEGAGLSKAEMVRIARGAVSVARASSSRWTSRLTAKVIGVINSSRSAATAGSTTLPGTVCAFRRVAPRSPDKDIDRDRLAVLSSIMHAHQQ